jgi:predicted Zn-dependent protease
VSKASRISLEYAGERTVGRAGLTLFKEMKTKSFVAVAFLSSMMLAQILLLAQAANITLKPTTPQQLEASQQLIQGSQLLKTKQPFKARPFLEKAAQLWPDEAHVRFNLGTCYNEMGDFPRAISEYEEALKLDHTLTEALPQIATCYQLMGEYNEAIAFFKEYLHQHPHAADEGQVEGMIAALNRQAGKQIDSDPQSGDYLTSIYHNGRLERWQYNRLPLKVFISNGNDDQGTPVPGFHENYNDMLLEALDTWVKASNYRLAYMLVGDSRNADIIFTWTNRNDFLKNESTSVEQGAARMQTRAMLNTGDQTMIVQGRVIIDICNPNTGQSLNDEDVKKTLLHEIGHALGLSGHSNNNKDVMFYSESPTVWAALTKRDKNTIARLYGDYPVFSWSRNAPVVPQAPMPYQPAMQMQQPPQSQFQPSAQFQQPPQYQVTPNPQYTAPMQSFPPGQQPFSQR